MQCMRKLANPLIVQETYFTRTSEIKEHHRHVGPIPCSFAETEITLKVPNINFLLHIETKTATKKKEPEKYITIRERDECFPQWKQRKAAFVWCQVQLSGTSRKRRSVATEKQAVFALFLDSYFRYLFNSHSSVFTNHAKTLCDQVDRKQKTLTFPCMIILSVSEAAGESLPLFTSELRSSVDMVTTVRFLWLREDVDGC